MALTMSQTLFPMILFMLISSTISITNAEYATKGDFEFKQYEEEKKTHLHFYFHDIVSGPNPTAVQVVSSKLTMLTSFGTVVMIDDPLTEGPDPGSKLIGRAQGTYSFASKEDVGLQMVLNYVFMDGEYDGSSLAMLGRNSVLSDVREMAIVGGTGVFRFARGYALAKTYQFNLITGDAIVEYDVFVVHN
ncbi:hypothetical protein QJS04_geneDACA009042 [Acorus gramineus]|uniref:Dirigent protein n=1 Tax=Acorus gramineus TaxID=55184 RepID=A0AAV9AQZ3_ACOGR|nr:hypothetical protein QJS04_geneDACA009042 [Acorus gramineus]